MIRLHCLTSAIRGLDLGRGGCHVEQSFFLLNCAYQMGDSFLPSGNLNQMLCMRHIIRWTMEKDLFLVEMNRGNCSRRMVSFVASPAGLVAFTVTVIKYVLFCT